MRAIYVGPTIAERVQNAARPGAGPHGHCYLPDGMAIFVGTEHVYLLDDDAPPVHELDLGGSDRDGVLRVLVLDFATGKVSSERREE